MRARYLHEGRHSGEVDAAQGSTVGEQGEGKQQLSVRAGNGTLIPPAARACGEMANSHTGHWVSVQGAMGHRNSHHIYRKVCVLDNMQHTQRNI